MPARFLPFAHTDFRKDYTKLSFFKQRFPGVPLLALTATATPRVQHDVVAQVHNTKQRCGGAGCSALPRQKLFRRSGYTPCTEGW